jgi:hypothetical protein
MGKVQKKCLEVLSDKTTRADGLFETPLVAASVFGVKTITAAQYASVRRALGILAKKGLVVNLGRSFHDNTGRWALPDAAKVHQEKEARFHATDFYKDSPKPKKEPRQKPKSK